ncbi:MAG: TonB-dependent receptor, partial [Bacteroidaceae bacterium]|nr:TonB-dependent receptor [Bacteroidaceae bacterium]
MKAELIGLLVLASMGTAKAQTPIDTTKVIDLEEVVVISSPKENQKLRQSPTAVSLLSAQDMGQQRVLSLKGASTLSPNFFIPDYGSRLTSAIYIRGVGSRINTPAVGMYVDNIPYLDKSAFDFNFYDIERMDILRGPQATLYGRNAMAGLVKIHTRSPFNYHGTDLKLGYATKDNHRNISLTHYHQIGEQFAFSAGGYYEGSDGFFRNNILQEKVDHMQSAGGRLRGIWKVSRNWAIDFNLNYDYSDEGGYPYLLYDVSPAGEWPGLEKGYVNNRAASYRRNLFNGGLSIEHQAQQFVMTATTGFQHLSDRMYLDQDFTNIDIYTLEQRQNLNALTQEITFRSKGNRRWDWVLGASGFVQGLRTTGPVTFRKDGVTWMQQLINGYMPDLSDMGMSMGVKINDEEFVTGGSFKTPVLNGALFHQSTFHLTDKLSASIGLRLDYERTKLDYDAAGTIHHDFTMTSPRMPIVLKGLQSDALFQGSIRNNYTQLLPKFSLQYEFDKQNNIYATVSKGYRSGGYNVQMFSDLLQSSLRNNMMKGIKKGTNDYL